MACQCEETHLGNPGLSKSTCRSGGKGGWDARRRMAVALHGSKENRQNRAADVGVILPLVEAFQEIFVVVEVQPSRRGLDVIFARKSGPTNVNAIYFISHQCPRLPPRDSNNS